MWSTELTIIKRNMSAMMYQGLAPVGGMAIYREVNMFPQNMKNAVCREVLDVMRKRISRISEQQS